MVNGFGHWPNQRAWEGSVSGTSLRWVAFPSSAPSDHHNIRDDRQKNKLTTLGVASWKDVFWLKDGALVWALIP